MGFNFIRHNAEFLVLNAQHTSQLLAKALQQMDRKPTLGWVDYPTSASGPKRFQAVGKTTVEGYEISLNLAVGDWRSMDYARHAGLHRMFRDRLKLLHDQAVALEAQGRAVKKKLAEIETEVLGRIPRLPPGWYRTEAMKRPPCARSFSENCPNSIRWRSNLSSPLRGTCDRISKRCFESVKDSIKKTATGSSRGRL